MKNMKKIIGLCLCLGILGMCGCGNIDVSSSAPASEQEVSSAASQDEASSNIKYIVHFRENAGYKDIEVSGEDAAEINALVKAVSASGTKNDGYSYSKKEAVKMGLAGGIPLMITEYRDDEEEVTYIFNEGESCSEGIVPSVLIIGYDYPDKDNMDAYDVGDRESFIMLSKKAAEVAG